MKQEMKVMVACTNRNGEADLFICKVKVSIDDYENGQHYDLAKKTASDEGYEGPYVCFDEHEQINIARQVPEMDPSMLGKLNIKIAGGVK